MTISPGSRLGPYEITAKLGEGGMGEVYRATDTRLHREVAIKVLPELFAQDRDRLARFTREAQLLASLNHPNIAALHGVEESGDTHALVMELVPGDTLAERLAQGGLPVEEALPIARQIAEALEEAHEHGVVHRDLKPQNVKLTPEGKVKVLDFGLAKAMDAGAASGSGASLNSPAVMNSPTLTAASTQLGVLLGTAAYMSPEQAKGKPVDRRADIWAFGVVLWEMLSGKRLFEGDSVPETLGAIFRQEISLDALPADLPAPVRALVARCLERDPRLRLRDIGEARILLQRAESGSFAAPLVAVPASSPRPTRRLALGALAIGALAVGVAGYLIGSRARPAATPGAGAGASSSAPSFQKLTFQPGVEEDPALSPDGRTLYFAARREGGKDRDIFFVPVGGKKPIDLTPDSTVDDSYPAVSPDGNRIAFRSERAGGGIFVMGSTGESARRITDFGFDPAWSPDGRSIVFTTEGAGNPMNRGGTGKIHIVDAASGSARSLETGDAAAPVWSPSGRRIAYWGVGADEAGRRDLWTVAAAGGEPVEVTHDPPTDWNPVWSSDGRWLYFLSDRGGAPNLWRIAIDEASGEVSGEPLSVVLPTEFALHVRAAAGRWVYTSRALRSTVTRQAFDPSTLRLEGTPETVIETTNLLLAVQPSPDGKTLAYTTVLPRQDLFVVGAGGGAPVQLTDDPARDRWPSWDPDMSRILFMSSRSGRYEIWGVRPDGSALEQVTRTTDESRWGPFLSPDRRRLATSSERGTSIFDATGAPPWESFTRLPNSPKHPGSTFEGFFWSPDGSQLAGALILRTGDALSPAVWSFVDQRYRVFEMRGTAIAWFADGRRLLAHGSDGSAVLDVATGAVKPLALDLPRNTDIAFSGDLRLMVTFHSDEESDVWLAEGLD